ncbi:cysteine-rich protein [Trametes coccinea BRFM310]|uniref:Cysteine-rich protein n=1 Tax=Trametes coccinea (strain BRFM310) TaxID=1353009 RepID=A0A1Y2IE73_TRAC3|nr:cysteine-rich protein [Trametes coccinea BRFM310]
MKLSVVVVPLAIAFSCLPSARAGLLSYGVCQTGCNALAVACYAAAGYTFGTVTAGLGTPAVVLGCNAALGKCSAACAVVALTPIP